MATPKREPKWKVKMTNSNRLGWDRLVGSSRKGVTDNRLGVATRSGTKRKHGEKAMIPSRQSDMSCRIWLRMLVAFRTAVLAISRVADSPG
jgi:hypothetical protein